MTSKGIAQRLLAKYGHEEAAWKVEDRIDSIAGLQAYFTTPEHTAALLACRMLWEAVHSHLEQA